MPVEQTFFEEEDQQQAPSQALAPQIGGIQPVVGPTAPSAPVTARREGSGRFRNLQRYIEANRPATQQMTGRLGGQIEKQAEGVRRGVQEAREQFQQQIAPEQQRLGGAQQLIQQAQAAPTQIAQTPEQLQQFQALRRGAGEFQQFQAPELSQQQLAAQQAQQAAERIGTEAGRFQLLREQFGGPRYTTGLQRLDQLLLQATPGEVERLQQLGQEAVTGLPEQISALQTQAGTQLGELGTQAGEAQSAIQRMLFGAGEAERIDTLPEIREEVERRLAQAGQERERLYGLAEAIEPTGAITDPGLIAQLQAAGIDLSQPLQTFGVDIGAGERIRRGEAPTALGIASPEEYQRFQALTQLAGEEAAPYGGVFGEGEAGAYAGPLAIDAPAIQQAIAERQRAYEEEFLGRIDPFGTAAARGSYVGPWSEMVGLTGQQAIERIQADPRYQQQYLRRIRGEAPLDKYDYNTIADMIASGLQGIQQQYNLADVIGTAEALKGRQMDPLAQFLPTQTRIK
jgi:hypothetical protein